MEENQSLKKSGTRQSTWKFEKWFTDTGNEGCNLFQRNACNQDKECKRAHVCKACQGITLLPIASSFPPVDSPLNLPCWVQSLTDHLNRTLVNELLCDITTVFTLASKVNDENTSQTIINQQILIPRPLPAKSH